MTGIPNAASESTELIFLSHSGADTQAAKKLAGLLRQGGVDVWLDGERLAAGDVLKRGKAREALEEFLQPDRVISMHSPDYRNGEDLGVMLRAAVLHAATAIQLEREQLRRESW
jgi:hypothetical protein